MYEISFDKSETERDLMFLFFKIISPCVGEMCPDIVFKNVDLPLPLGPINKIVSPSFMLVLIFR